MRSSFKFALLVGAQFLAFPASAQRSGVLLGLSETRTLWIAPDSTGRVHILENDSLLLVPRATGFWKVGRVAAGAAGEDTLARWSTDSLWAAPLDWPARRPRPAGPGAPEADSAEADESEDAFGFSERHVTFVSPTQVSVTEHYESNAALPSYGNPASVDPLEALAIAGIGTVPRDAGLPLDTSEATRGRFHAPCARQYRQAARDEGLGLSLTFDEMASWASENWYIARGAGRWQLVRRFWVGTGAGRGFVFDCDAPYRLPARIVGHDTLRPAWGQIARQVPGATDAVASPSGDLVVVLTPDRLRAFTPRGQRLGAAVAELPVQSPQIVMAQWATGRHVRRWGAALAPWLTPPRRAGSP